MGTSIHHRFERKNPETHRWEPIKGNHPGDCQYRLFAWLADVTNGYGFAGSRWAVEGQRVRPIAEPRGLPNDIENVGDWEFGAYSYSWLTADEILADFTNNDSLIITAVGYLSREQYELWDKKTPPEFYYAHISGANVIEFSTGNPDWTHIQVEWEEDLRDGFSDFINEIKRLKELHGEVRMVFGFDS